MPGKGSVVTRRAFNEDGSEITIIGERDAATLLNVHQTTLRNYRLAGRVNPNYLVTLPLWRKQARGVKVWYNGDLLSVFLHDGANAPEFLLAGE